TGSAWIDACNRYRRSVLGIICGSAIGTGWLAAAGPTGFLLVTASHVVEPALAERTPVQLHHEDLAARLTLPSMVPCSSLLHSDAHDLAVLTVPMPAPGPTLPLVHKVPDERGVRYHARACLGVEVGWLGFAESSYLAFGKPTVTFAKGPICAV